MPVVEVDGHRMAFERRGRGASVVLVHGYVGDGRSTWRPQLDGLAGAVDLVALDLPGAGGSDDPPDEFGIGGFADAVAGFIGTLGLRSPHVVGLSFGGVTAIELCRHHPTLPATVTLVGAYAGWGGSLAPEESRRRLEQALDLAGRRPQDLVDALLPTMFAPSASPDVVAGFAAALAAFHPAGLRAMAHACGADLTDVLGSIRVPTLLVNGAEDTRAPDRVAAGLQAAIPGSERVVLAGAGHVCNIDAAEAFNDTLRHFLRRHPVR